MFGKSKLIIKGERLTVNEQVFLANFKPKMSSRSKERTKVAERVDAPRPKAKTRDVVRNAPVDRVAAKKSESEIRTITVHKQITYGQFADRYGASTSQLNELNGLSLNKNTMLAIGSELYVPKH